MLQITLIYITFRANYWFLSSTYLFPIALWINLHLSITFLLTCPYYGMSISWPTSLSRESFNGHIQCLFWWIITLSWNHSCSKMCLLTLIRSKAQRSFTGILLYMLLTIMCTRSSIQITYLGYSRNIYCTITLHSLCSLRLLTI